MSPLKYQALRGSALVIAMFSQVACHSTRPDAKMVEFGPPEAEAEIRLVFGITGAMPTVDELIRMAGSRHMDHEAMTHDRSLTYCQVGRNRNALNLEMFYAGRDEARRAALNYLVVYTANRQVVCIETRHSYPGF